MLDKYSYLNSFFTTFLMAIEEDSKKSDFEIVKDFIDESTSEAILRALKEGDEVMAIEPFPWEFIRDLTNSLVYDEEKQKYVEDPVIYKIWTQKMLGLLKEEATGQGKI